MYYENNANKITVFDFLFHLFVEMLFGLHCSLKFEEYAIKKMKTLFLFRIAPHPHSTCHLFCVHKLETYPYVWIGHARKLQYWLIYLYGIGTETDDYDACQPMAVLDLRQFWIFDCTHNILLTQNWNRASLKYNLATSFDLVTHKLNYLKTLKYITDMSRTSSCLTIIITTTMLYSYTLSTDYNDFSERSYCIILWKHKWLMILTWSPCLFWYIFRDFGFRYY